jgi:hypothetical protein
VELETQLADVKAELKSRKEEARLMIEEMEKIGRDLATRKTIPTQIERKKNVHDELFSTNRVARSTQ